MARPKDGVIEAAAEVATRFIGRLFEVRGVVRLDRAIYVGYPVGDGAPGQEGRTPSINKDSNVEVASFVYGLKLKSF